LTVNKGLTGAFVVSQHRIVMAEEEKQVGAEDNQKNEEQRRRAMVSVRIPEDLKLKLDAIAEEEGKYSSDIVKELIKSRVEMKNLGIEVKDTESSVGLDRLLDDLIQYQRRRDELEKLIGDRGWFSSAPEHLRQAKQLCDRKLEQLGTRLKVLFPGGSVIFCRKCGFDLSPAVIKVHADGRKMRFCSNCEEPLDWAAVLQELGQANKRTSSGDDDIDDI